ncbi:unnamed protein product [Euphydryas editha]|uniref:Uncharacterized protein n=1 Tax=Euphydryas editha TaxID=104508 RepID=A0AAU9TU66_EUPED|nr:unnamed protein product [Euphydryas editha]
MNDLHPRLADDISIFAEILDVLGRMLDDLNESSQLFGLGMYLDKRKVMFNKQVIPKQLFINLVPFSKLYKIRSV